MRGPLLFLTVVDVVVLADLGILRCWGWDLDFVQGLCLYGIVVEIAVVHYRLLLLDYCQWMEQLQLVGVSMEVVMAVHDLVLPAILQN